MKTVSTIVFALFVASCAAGGKIAAVTEKPAIPLAQGEQTRPVALVAVRLDIGRERAVGALGSGAFCAKVDDWTVKPSNIEDPELERTFAGELRQIGYNVPQGAGSIFQSNASHAELMIGATIVKLQQDVCIPNFRGYGGHSSAAAMTVKWEVADARSKAVLYTVETEGSGKASGKSSAPEVALYESFEVAVRNLTAEQGFHDIVLAKAPVSSNLGATGSSGGAGGQAGRFAGLTIQSQPLWRTSIADNIETITKNTVLVSASDGSFGSGFYIDANGHVLTNHHVIDGVPRIFIRLANGEEREGKVLASDAERDIALIGTEAPQGIRGIPLRLNPPGIGNDVYVLGAPSDEKLVNTLTKGVLSAERHWEGHDYLQSDVQVTHGNSGGPMLDENGNVIGLTVFGIKSANGEDIKINLFIPIKSALATLNIHKLAP